MTDLRITDLEQLIARLEAASKGSRDLDRAIHLVVFADFIKERGMTEEGNGWRDPEFGAIAPPQDYTTSIDAALTLVPPIWRVYAIQEQYVDPPNLWFVGLDRRREHRESMIGKAPTPALALCIAALKARMK